MKTYYYLLRGISTEEVYAIAATVVDFSERFYGQDGQQVLLDSLGPAYREIMSPRPSGEREGMKYVPTDKNQWETLREFGVPNLALGLDYCDEWVGKYPNSHKVLRVYPSVRLTRPPNAATN